MTKDSSNLPGALERSHDETRSAFENRALMYAYIHDELVKELGPEPARELMKRAIRRRGVETGRVYHNAAAAGDLAEVARLFCEGSPCGGSLFEPGIDEEADEGRVVLRMTACPLVDAWKAAGYYSLAEIAVARGDVQIMNNEHNSLAELAVETAQAIYHVELVRHVKKCCRFVQKQEARLLRKQHCNPRQLSLAGTQVAQTLFAQPGDPGKFERGIDGVVVFRCQ